MVRVCTRSVPSGEVLLRNEVQFCGHRMGTRAYIATRGSARKDGGSGCVERIDASVDGLVGGLAENVHASRAERWTVDGRRVRTASACELSLSVRPSFSSFWIALSLAASACSSDATPQVAPPNTVPDAAPGDDAPTSTEDAAAVDVGHERGTVDAGRDVAVGPDGSASDAASEAAEGRADASDAGRSILCVRLSDPTRPNAITMLAEQVDKEYVTRVYRDCNVARMAREDLDTIFQFYNDLLIFSLDLWGCTQRQVSTFGILRPISVTELTSADAARLIDHYVGAATTILRLDIAEAAQMRQDLTRLGQTAITRTSPEFALSTCGVDGGTEGGDAAEGGSTGDGDTLDAATEQSDAVGDAGRAE
jgi:hypothetical protein